MKCKVLKDYVGCLGNLVKAGETFYVEHPADVPFIKGLLENGFIEEIKDEPWVPKTGNLYYYTNSCGDVYPEGHFSSNNENDAARFAMGNCFQTEEQAEKAVEWLKALRVLREDTKGFKPNWENGEQQKWHVCYGYSLHQLEVSYRQLWTSEIILFATKEDAEESIKKHPDAWKTFLGVEEEE